MLTLAGTVYVYGTLSGGETGPFAVSDILFLGTNRATCAFYLKFFADKTVKGFHLSGWAQRAAMYTKLYYINKVSPNFLAALTFPLRFATFSLL